MLKPSQTSLSFTDDFPPVCQNTFPSGSKILNDHAFTTAFEDAESEIIKSSSVPSLSGLKYLGLVETESNGGVTVHKNGEETAFQQTIDPEFTGYKEISPEAKSITLQLYEVKNDTAHQVFEEKTDKDSSDDVYEEFAGYVYDDGENPTDAGVPIGDRFTLQIR